MIRVLLLTLLLASCNEHFNAGRKQYDKLPVDGRNPIILLNDSADENWMGEYAMLLANSGGPDLRGIILVTGGVNEDLKKNNKGWVDMVDAANKGGLRNIPDPTPSFAEKLVRPERGIIDETDVSLNRSPGAHFIVDESKRVSLPYRPLVVVAAARLTDVASAYLIDHSVTERVVVVASVGKLTGSGATMDKPNGEMDPWASTIVATKFQYIQVSARYDSQLDIPDERLQDLPRNNKFSDWIYRKQPNVWSLTDAADQVAVEAVGIPGFVTDVDRVSVDPTGDASSTTGPNLQHDPSGNVLLVRGVSPDAAIARLWQMFQNPSLFAAPEASTDAK
jgi:hypothetical protein